MITTRPPRWRRRRSSRYAHIETIANGILDLAGRVSWCNDADAKELYREASATYIRVMDGERTRLLRPGQDTRRLERASFQIKTVRSILDDAPRPPAPEPRRPPWGAIVTATLAAIVAVVVAVAAIQGDDPAALPAVPVPGEELPDTLPETETPPPSAEPIATPVTGAPRRVDEVPVAEPPGTMIDTVAVTDAPPVLVGSAASEDAGGPLIRLSTGNHPALAIGSDQTPMVLHGGGLDSCWDESCDYFETQSVHPSVNVPQAIAVRDNGLPVMAYFDTATGLGPEGALSVAACQDPLCQIPLEETVLMTGFTEEGLPALTLDHDGNPVIAHLEPPRGPVHLIRCHTFACSEASAVIVGESDLYGHQLGVGIAADGTPVVAAYDLATQRLTVVTCADPDCRERMTLSAIEVGSARVHVTVALEMVDGLPVAIVGTKGALGVLQCRDVACSDEPSIRWVPTDDDFTMWLSTDVGADGALHIGYLDMEGARRIVSCPDPACAEYEVVSLPDEPQWGGPSVAALDDGLLVAYSGINFEDVLLQRLP